VRRRSEPFVLKLTWPADGVAEEVRGLEAWDGQGMVQMVAADVRVGALLLERLDADRTLRAMEAMEATRVAGKLLRRLAIPAPPGFRNVRTLVAGTARSLEVHTGRTASPIPPEWLKTALQLARYLAIHASTNLLIHADLHYDNILAGQREPWLAIDPRPVAGEPEQAVPELLWTRHDVVSEEGIRHLLCAAVDSARLDAERTRWWVIVRCVDYWLWGLAHSLTQDPKRCRLILQALMSEGIRAFR
jgi:streptomycin 6-kinase